MSAAAAPGFGRLVAPPHWRSLEFISDLHLQPAEPATFEGWRRYMAGSTADAIFILGDLFEAWPGDDAALQPGFDAECAAVLRAASQRRPVFFMHGNRDFLVRAPLAEITGIKLLADPTALDFAGQRWVLSHADALCLGDTDYLRFRGEVRQPAWQENFLAQPLARRQQAARGLREQSEARKRSGMPYADVDTAAAAAWLSAAGATTLIHGHTHRPGEHDLPGGRRRIVLSDWDAGATPPRMEALRLDAAGARRVALA